MLAALRSDKIVDRDEILAAWRAMDPDALPEADIEAALIRLADAGYDLADVRRMLDQFRETGNLAFWRQAINELSFARNLTDPASQLFAKYADLEPITRRQLPALKRELDELDAQGYDVDAVRLALDDFEDAARNTKDWEDAWERVTVAMDAIPERPAVDPFDGLDGAELQDALLQEGRVNLHNVARELGYTEIEEVIPTRGIVRYGLDSTEVLELVDELKATIGPDGKPLPGREVDYEVLNERLEGVIQAERDRMSGIEPGSDIGQTLWDREHDLGPIARPVKLHQSLGELADDERAMLAEFERFLRSAGLGYTLKKAPTLGTMLRDDDGRMTAALKQRTALGHWLFDYGPLSQFTGFMSWLFRPVANQVLAQAARQALYNELLPHHATPEQVDAFIEAMKGEAAKHSFKLPGGPRIHIFRSPQSLLPSDINLIAAGRLAEGGEHVQAPAGQSGGIFSAKTIEEIGPNNFFRILDRASNRFIRSLEYRPRGHRPGKPMNAIVGAYDFWTGTRWGAGSRIVSKFFYPLFRFTADPRWLFLNALEADILGGLRDGLRATSVFGKAGSTEPSAATKLHALAHPIDAFDDQWLESTFLWNRNLGGHVSKSFDHRRPESTIEVLNSLEQGNPILRELKERFGTDDTRTLAEHLEQMLYDWDTIGTRQTLDDAILQEVSKGTMSHQDIEAMRPLLNELWWRHEELYVDIARMYRGSTDRSNIERILNSYWLFWPISYQIKATKWLFDLLTEGVGGRQTNLGGAAWLEEQRRRHEQRLVQDEAYREEFRRRPTGWFMAQMLMPITPFDMGVSLNRAMRFAGGMVGLWERDDRTNSLATMASALAVMGPIYTAELLERFGRDIERGQRESEPEEFELPQLPAPVLPTAPPGAAPTLGGSGA